MSGLLLLLADDPPEDTHTAGGRALPPPVYVVSGVAAAREGDHTHPCWDVRAVHAQLPAISLPMVAKAVPSDVVAAVELACGLAAQELRLDVPRPGLLLAAREDLPDLPEDFPAGNPVLLVGSHYKRPSAAHVQVMGNDTAAEALVWEALCSSGQAPQGAAWDELIANADRHCENLLFDGTTWWFFDHDQALPPAANFSADPQNAQARLAASQFAPAVNQVATELLRRSRPTPSTVREATRRIMAGSKRLQAMARHAVHWRHEHPKAHDVLRLAGVILGLIQLRLPALTEQLHRRLGLPPPGPSLWS